MAQIFDQNERNRPYLRAIYKARYDDAFDASLFHMLDNYDPEKGPLKNYAISINKKILYNERRKETAQDDQVLLYFVDKETGKLGNPEDSFFESEEERDLRECKNDLSTYFIGDFKFFITGKASYRHKNYDQLYEKYPMDILKRAIHDIKVDYLERVQNFLDCRNEVHIDMSDETKYLRRISRTYSIVAIHNGIAIIRSNSNTKKTFSKLDIKTVVNDIIADFYESKVGGIDPTIKIYDRKFYMGISGGIYDNIDDLRKGIEYDIVGEAINQGMKNVVRYDKGDAIYFNRRDKDRIDIKVFNKVYRVRLKEIYTKEITNEAFYYGVESPALV